MRDRYVDEVVHGPRLDRYKALLVLDEAGGKGKTQFFLAAAPCVYFRLSVNWRSWNTQRSATPEPRVLIMDDVDWFGPESNVRTANRKKAILNGTACFSVCTTGGAYAYNIKHGLPVVVLTNDVGVYHAFLRDAYFQHHMEFVRLEARCNSL